MYVSAFFNKTLTPAPTSVASAPTNGELHAVKAAPSPVPWPANLSSRAVRFPSSRKFLWDRTPLGRVEVVEPKDIIPALKVPTDLHRLLGQEASAFAALSCPDGRRLHISLRHVSPKSSEEVLAIQVQVSHVSERPYDPQPQGLVAAFRYSLDQRGSARLSTGFVLSLALNVDGLEPRGMGIGSGGARQGSLATLTATLLLPATALTLTPLYGKRMCDVPLAHSLSQQQATGGVDVQTGYLTMDQARSLLPLAADDANVYSMPLVGVWVRGARGVEHPTVYGAALKFAFSSTLPDRAMQPDGAFLLLLFTGDSPVARCYEARFADRPPYPETHQLGHEQRCLPKGQAEHPVCGGLKLLPYIAQAELLGQTDAPLELRPIADHRASARGCLVLPLPSTAASHAPNPLSTSGTPTARSSCADALGAAPGTANGATPGLHGKYDVYGAFQLRGSGSKLMTSPSKAMKIQGSGAKGAAVEDGGIPLAAARPAAGCGSSILSTAAQHGGVGPWSEHLRAGTRKESPPVPRSSCLPAPIRALPVQGDAAYTETGNSDSNAQPRDPRLQRRSAAAAAPVATAPAQGPGAVERSDPVAGVMSTPGFVTELRSTPRGAAAAAAPDAYFNPYRSQHPILEQFQLRSVALRQQLEQQAADSARSAAGQLAGPSSAAQTPRAALHAAGFAGDGDPRPALERFTLFATGAGNSGNGASWSQQGPYTSSSSSAQHAVQHAGKLDAPPAPELGAAADVGQPVGLGDGVACGNDAPKGTCSTAPRMEHRTAASHSLDAWLHAGGLPAAGSPLWRAAAAAAAPPAAGSWHPTHALTLEAPRAADRPLNTVCVAAAQPPCSEASGVERPGPAASVWYNEQLPDTRPPMLCPLPSATCAGPQLHVQAANPVRPQADAEGLMLHGLLASRDGTQSGQQLPGPVAPQQQGGSCGNSAQSYLIGGAPQQQELARQPQEQSEWSAAAPSGDTMATADKQDCLDNLPTDPALLREEVISLRRQVKYLQEQLRQLTDYQPTIGDCPNRLQLIASPNPPNESVRLISTASAANDDCQFPRERVLHEAAPGTHRCSKHDNRPLHDQEPELQPQTALQRRQYNGQEGGPSLRSDGLAEQPSLPGAQGSCVAGDAPCRASSANGAAHAMAESAEDQRAAYARQACERSDQMSVSAASDRGSVWSMASLRSSILSYHSSRSLETSSSLADVEGRGADAHVSAAGSKDGLRLVAGVRSSHDAAPGGGAGLEAGVESDAAPAAAAASTSVPMNGWKGLGEGGCPKLEAEGWPPTVTANCSKYSRQGGFCGLAPSSGRGRRRAREASSSDESDHERSSDPEDHDTTSRRLALTIPGATRAAALTDKTPGASAPRQFHEDQTLFNSTSDVSGRPSNPCIKDDSAVIRTMYIPLDEDSDSSDSECELLLMQKYGIHA